MKACNVMIVGVGGQGTLLSSRILGRVFLKNGFDVKISEVHGMSQRGGSVVTYVRAGEKVYSPLIENGEADFILAFEKIEGARYISGLKKDGVLITNNRETEPMTVITGDAAYPHDALLMLSENGVKIDELDALSLAEEAGSAKAVNVVLLGRMSRLFDFPESDWLEAIDEMVKPAFREMNRKAFFLGKESAN